MKIDRQAIIKMSKDLARPAHTLIALSAVNDPFYLTESRERDARWFAELYRQFRFGRGVHLRRIHYRIISQRQQIMLPTGGRYLNTEKCWSMLCDAAKDARYSRLIDIDDFVDQRNEEAVVYSAETPPRRPSITAYSNYVSIEIPDDVPKPGLFLICDRSPSRLMFHLEIWCEKSTINDVLMPLGAQYGVNIQTSVGEMSLTRCKQLVERVANNGGRPVRVLYISDFDPGGMSMPVAAARKTEWLLREIVEEGSYSNVQLQPIVLTHEQCVQYRLPRTPIKKKEKRAALFEGRFGEGATELDALEALYPGVLRRIIVTEIERFKDEDFDRRWLRAQVEGNRRINEISTPIIERHAITVSGLQERLDELRAEAEAIVDEIGAHNDAVGDELLAAVPDISEFGFPDLNNVKANEWPDPLFDSDREYLEQNDRFKDHQGKPKERKGGQRMDPVAYNRLTSRLRRAKTPAARKAALADLEKLRAKTKAVPQKVTIAGRGHHKPRSPR